MDNNNHGEENQKEDEDSEPISDTSEKYPILTNPFFYGIIKQNRKRLRQE